MGSFLNDWFLVQFLAISWFRQSENAVRACLSPRKHLIETLNGDTFSTQLRWIIFFISAQYSQCVRFTGFIGRIWQKWDIIFINMFPLGSNHLKIRTAVFFLPYNELFISIRRVTILQIHDSV